MAYIVMNFDALLNIFRRWKAGYRISETARQTGFDRKTVRAYIALFKEHRLDSFADSQNEELCDKLRALLKQANTRVSNRECEAVLKGYLEEIKGYITDKEHPMKPKSAFEVITEKYGLLLSYSSFKRFCRRYLCNEKKSPLRIEMPPGREIQIDYGKVGCLRIGNSNKVVYAFCALLSASRLPFVLFVLKQDQVSFCESHLNMWDYYGGTTEVVTLDNLKAGVITPDLYDPLMNKSYADMLAHYGVFGDTTRVRCPRDKGKIERFIPVARELWRKLVALHPEKDLAFYNEKAQAYCRSGYGMKKHGTTGVEPWIVFESQEKNLLRPLPQERFVIPVWKEAKVHPDRFIQFQKKTYHVGQDYVGEMVWARKTGNLVMIFKDSKLLKTYTIPRGHRAYDPRDFSDVQSSMMEAGFPKYLLEKALKRGDVAYEFVKQILTPHAYINSRRAQAILDVIDDNRHNEHYDEILNQAMRTKTHDSKTLREMFEEDSQQLRFDESPVISGDLGKEMTRDASYYFH